MKILGIDYGREKIGLAVGDTVTKLIEPLQVLSSSKFKMKSSKLVKDCGVEKVVIGISGGKMEQEIRVFGESLKKELGIGVEFADETLSTQEAQKELIEHQRKRKYRREKEDAVAAAIMLESYLGRLR